MVFILTPEKLILVILFGSLFLDVTYFMLDTFLYWFFVRVMKHEDFENRYGLQETDSVR